MARRRKDRSAQDIRLAQQRAKVRFGPEHSTIRAAIGQAQSQLGGDLIAADAAAKSAIHFAKKAKKPVAAVFNQARSEADAARSDVEAAFGKLGGAADPFRAATAREQAGAHERVALAGANALHELTQRQLEAKAGGQYAKTAAKQDYRKTLSDLAGRLSDLGDREGAFITSEAGSLREARAGRHATLTGIRLRGKQDRQQAATKLESDKELAKYKSDLKPKTGGGKSKALGGNKPATRAELRGFTSSFAEAVQQAKEAQAHNVGRHGAAVTLTKGTTGKNAIPKIKDQLALSAALDMAYAGYIGRTTAQRLHKAGIRVKDLPGAVSYTNRPRSGSRIRSGPLGY